MQRLFKDWFGRTLHLQNNFGVGFIVDKQDSRCFKVVMVARNDSNDSVPKVRELYISICPTVISRNGWLYTCNDDRLRNYIGQYVIDTIESKCDRDLSEDVLKLSFEYGMGCASRSRRSKSSFRRH